MQKHEIEHLPLRSIKPNPKNAKTHPSAQIRGLAASMSALNYFSPIVIDENAKIIAGHGRYEAAKHLSLPSVPTIRILGLNDAQKRALALADNKIVEKGGWNFELLAIELRELAVLLPANNLDLSITGFDPAEVDVLLGDYVDPEGEPVDEIPSPANVPISQRGDAWLLGSHRLLCGDATASADVSRLMNSAVAAGVITDPPYNVRIKSIQGRGRTKHGEFLQASGEMSSSEFIRFLQSALKLIANHSAEGSLHYVFMDWRHAGELLSVGTKVYSELNNIVVWVKTNAGQGSFYRSQHELVFVYKLGDIPHLNNVLLGKNGRNRSNVWTYAGVNTFRAGRMDELSMHPTVKPVAMIADAIRDCTRRGDIVLDPFMGSGTTIMAAERVGRRAFGLEIDPRYVDVAIHRWQQFTKRDAVHERTGKTFDQVAASRSKRSR